MNFKEAYQEMLNGEKIKRPDWGGFWFIEDGKVKIQLKTGEIIENDFNQETITNTLADDWVVVKESKKYWKPEMCNDYYYIDWDGDVDSMTYDNAPSDRRAINIGNCFEELEQAEFMAEKLRVIYELEKFAYENNEEEIDWNNDGQKKFFVYYDYFNNTVFVDYVTYMKDTPFNIYFTREFIAEKSIEAIGKERLIKYYFGVKDE